MQAAVILMSRAPIPGKTKTRLESHLTGEECAELHRAFLKDINYKLLNLQRSLSGIDLYLSYTPAAESKIFSGLIDDKFIRILQRGQDLGEKMYNALADAQQKSKLPVIITGSDLPFLDIPIFAEALAGLKAADLVIGPSDDGGYYLIGMKNPAKFIFDFKQWGTESVLENTIREAGKHNLKIHFLPELSDIDTFKELLQLRAELIKEKAAANYSRNTKNVIKEIFS